MTTTPDPQVVHDLAQEVADIALHDAVHVDQWITAVVNNRFGNECSQFRAPLHAAVARRMAAVKPTWPADQPQDDADVRAVAAMSDARLERLAGLAELPCTCQDADCGNFTSALTAQEARELVAEAKRARTAMKYGTWVDGDDGMEWVPCVNGSLRVYGCRCPTCVALEARDAKAGK